MSLIKEVNQAAINKFRNLVQDWLPGGRLEGSEYIVRNPTRADNKPGSFSININSGRWSDFATGDKGSDPISLYAYLNKLTQGKAAKELAISLGISSGNYKKEKDVGVAIVPNQHRNIWSNLILKIFTMRRINRK